MKNYETLKNVKDIGILLQYFSADEKNTITMNYGNYEAIIWMDNNCNLWRKYPKFPETYIADSCRLFNLLDLFGMVKQLKEKNKWEELQAKVNLALIEASGKLEQCCYCGSYDIERTLGESKYAFYETITCNKCGFVLHNTEWIKKGMEDDN